MFNKKFSFRKKKGDGRDELDTDPDQLFIASPPVDTPRLPSSSIPAESNTPQRYSSPGSLLLRANVLDRNRASSSGITGQTISDAAADADPLGLKVVHRPAEARTVDIVFVHGLGGSSRRTWSKDHNPDFFWPLKFLPFETGIREARISTFGYNANFRGGGRKNKLSILDFAKNLLFELKYAQDESMGELQDLDMGARPIIFVVHSMGGLIVKEAYMQGQNDPKYEGIIKAVSAIVFLSTPHRGTNLAKTLNRILQVSFVSNAVPFIAELTTGSQTLQKLNEQFRHVAPKLEIVSFYETRPTTIFKAKVQVLEKDSSVLGYPGEISMPLDADHHSVCKYESKVDPRYVAVRNVLKNLVMKCLQEDQAHKSPSNASKSTFEQLLAVSETPERDYNFFRDRWAPGTCSWILDHPVFIDWLNGVQLTPKVLWIQGNAASGKSVLSSFLIDHFVQLGLPSQYFFIRDEDEKKRALSTLLRSLACQIAKSVPAYARQIRQLEAAGTDLKSQDCRNIWQWLYKQALFQLDLGEPLYWVLDGIDESENPRSLLNLISELCSVNLPIRIIIVSRTTHDIAISFQKLSEQWKTQTITTKGNQDDFHRYINSELHLAGEDSYRENIITEVLKRAQGNFLWVHLAVQKLNKCHTKVDVSNALTNLPPDMEALYDRMANSVQTAQNSNSPTLGERILGWATHVQRPLTVPELSDALRDDGVLEMHRTIADLCGGFVVVDLEGRVALIHETAREYLSRETNHRQQSGVTLALEPKQIHDNLFERCISRLMDRTLRAQISQGRHPALLDYAAGAWVFHLSHGSATSRANLVVLMRFFEGAPVLTWIQAAARGRQLRSLVTASRRLGDIVERLRQFNDEESLLHRQAIESLTRWATDLVKLVGKFGTSLLQKPDAIYKLIPPFCPEDSAIYQQFGRKESKALRISGFTRGTWDDCLARLSLEQGVVASAVHASGGRITVLANRQRAGCIFVYNAVTWEEERQVVHPERVFKICVDALGATLVSYGYKTTRVWSLATGECIKSVTNPASRPRPQSIVFLEKSRAVLVAGEDWCVRLLGVDDDSTTWQIRARIEEENPDDSVLNAPTCSALSPDGEMIAFGYRGHPVTVWQVGSEELVGRCNMTPDGTSVTIQENTMGEITQLAWHPFSGEVLGLHREGLLFKWDPYDDEAGATVQAGAHFLAVSLDGSLVATGDTRGTVKAYTTADFSLLYQLSSPDPVLDISFSTDSRRLYDIRGAYGNVWEPSALVRLAESSELTDHSSDAWGESDSLAKQPLQIGHTFPGVDNVVTLSGQSNGGLYCYGTEDGVAVLGEVGRGRVAELARSPGFMSVEHVAWSDDGRFVALVDLNRRLIVKKISKPAQVGTGTWQVEHSFHLTLPSQDGINQVLFQPGGQRLLAVSSTALFTVELESPDVRVSAVPEGSSRVKWICHPTKPDHLLAFGNTKCHIFTWEGLRQVAEQTYFPPRLSRAATLSSHLPAYRSSSFRADEETLGRLISCPGSPDILLQVWTPTEAGRPERKYLLFTADDIITDHEKDDQPTSTDNTSEAHSLNTFPYTPLPDEVASRIREPLAILSRKRLVFLDIDRWICTWRISPTPAPRRPSGGKGSDIEAHYFLPSDWVTANEAHLCTVLPDGTLLCTRNGEVGAVQCAKLRR